MSRALPPVTSLEQGEHTCLFYRTPAEQAAAVVPFVRAGLARGERCLYIAHDRQVDDVYAGLAKTGVNVTDAVERGALKVCEAQDAYGRWGNFYPDDMLALLAEAIDGAQAAGFTGLRASGEMTWALDGMPGSDRLIEYEAMLTPFLASRRALGLCQYDITRFAAAAVHGVLRTHKHVVFDKHVRTSPFYGSHVESVEWMLGQLACGPARLEHQ